MDEVQILRLVFGGMGAVSIALALLLMLLNASSATKYRSYSGRIVNYHHEMDQTGYTPEVEFEANGQTVRGYANGISYSERKRLEGMMDLTIYAYPRNGALAGTWKCLIDTGSAFSRPGVLRVLPLSLLLLLVGCVFFLVMLQIA